MGSKFTRTDIASLTKALSLAVEEGARHLQGDIIEVTPRDPNRLPKDPSQPVTGMLKRSIGTERVNDTTYKVGVIGAWVKGDMIISKGKGANPAQYWVYQEFGTIRMKPRSFIRLTRARKKQKIHETIVKTFRKYMRK